MTVLRCNGKKIWFFFLQYTQGFFTKSDTNSMMMILFDQVTCLSVAKYLLFDIITLCNSLILFILKPKNKNVLFFFIQRNIVVDLVKMRYFVLCSFSLINTLMGT